jgi:anti-sigma factor RsiW
MREEEVSSRSHQEIQDLLPWYVNETLTAAEREAIDAHLPACSACLTELDTLRDLRSAIKTSNERLPFPSNAQIDLLTAQVEKFEFENRRPSLITRFGDWWVSQPPLAKQVFVAQALALIVLTGISLVLMKRVDSLRATALEEQKRADLNGSLLAVEKQRNIEYQALSARPDASGPDFRITVVFREDATEKDIRELLLSITGARIIAGPTPARFYVLGINAPPDSDLQKLTNEAIAQLRRRQDVVQLAEPLP